MSESGLSGVPLSIRPLDRKDFAAPVEVRWCPGCGDYVILNTVQSLLPGLGIGRENTVVVSGIGCSSRFPYYLNSYGMHSIHGRAPAIATGLAMSRPDLAVLVVTGDGDALSIGGNHLIHALRRNVNITILLFNNRIYGLTKGQFSPTSEQGKVTKSSPVGSLETPLNAVCLALGAEATFVARTIDADQEHLGATIRAAMEHRGAALVEIYQNCAIFNDGAWEGLTAADSDTRFPLVDGQPVLSTSGRFGVRALNDGSLEVVDTRDMAPSQVIIHDSTLADASQAFALARLTDAGVMHQAPVGIFRRVSRPCFDDLSRALLPDQPDDLADLQELLTGGDTWTRDPASPAG